MGLSIFVPPATGGARGSGGTCARPAAPLLIESDTSQDSDPSFRLAPEAYDDTALDAADRREADAFARAERRPHPDDCGLKTRQRRCYPCAGSAWKIATLQLCTSRSGAFLGVGRPSPVHHLFPFARGAGAASLPHHANRGGAAPWRIWSRRLSYGLGWQTADGSNPSSWSRASTGRAGCSTSPTSGRVGLGATSASASGAAPAFVSGATSTVFTGSSATTSATRFPSPFTRKTARSSRSSGPSLIHSEATRHRCRGRHPRPDAERGNGVAA